MMFTLISRLLVYEVMLDHLDKTENDLNPSKSNLQFIAEDVKSQSYIILSLLEKHQNQVFKQYIKDTC